MVILYHLALRLHRSGPRRLEQLPRAAGAVDISEAQQRISTIGELRSSDPNQAATSAYISCKTSELLRASEHAVPERAGSRWLRETIREQRQEAKHQCDERPQPMVEMGVHGGWGQLSPRLWPLGAHMHPATARTRVCPKLQVLCRLLALEPV